MNNGYYYQLLGSFGREANRFSYPRFLKDLVRTGDLDDVKQVEEVMATEIAESSLHDDNGAEYFVHMTESAMLFALYREDFDRFADVHELGIKRLMTLRSSGNARIDVDNWLWYFEYLSNAAKRLQRNANIESFEVGIDEIDWEELDEEFIYRISGITGYVYLNEEDKSKFGKARFWLHKAIMDSDIASGIVYYMNLADFYLAEQNKENSKRIEDHIQKLEDEANSAMDPNLARLLRSAVLELQARALIFKAGRYDDDHIKIEENLRKVREVERNMDMEGKSSPAFVRAFMKLVFSRYYLNLTTYDLDKDDIEDLQAMALDDVNEAMSIARRMRDDALKAYMKMEWLSVASVRQSKVTEKDFKEVLANVRKGDNFPAFVEASSHFSRFHLLQNESKKAYDALTDLVKRGNKRINEGGFYLVTKGMSLVNTIMIAETKRPGVSWIVEELDPYFASITEMIDEMEDNLEAIGQELVGRFAEEFMRFEAASHLNLKVYLRYQYYEMKVLRLLAILREDEMATRIANNLLNEVSDENNPLSFVQAEWEEFKTVPNSVRNKVLNKCISISKGDLPLAAEHLDFSYRNLRSYITFKEVNRLGFFLDLQDTNMKQLEQGIRLMFFDLYKRGTIFEVVFDMPKFLVEHAKSGFSSQDLEEALNIKGTTAKKYIKIMMEIGLIKHERSVGRKHFYKLRKDNVMNRLGKDQIVLVS